MIVERFGFRVTVTAQRVGVCKGSGKPLVTNANLDAECDWCGKRITMRKDFTIRQHQRPTR